MFMVSINVHTLCYTLYGFDMHMKMYDIPCWYFTRKIHGDKILYAQSIYSSFVAPESLETTGITVSTLGVFQCLIVEIMQCVASSHWLLSLAITI